MPERPRRETPLARLIKADLAAGMDYTFADYMQLALLHPEHGYYARGPEIGPHGDFYTAAALPAFGKSLARFFAAARERMGNPPDFRVVELGGGTGELARAIVTAWAEMGLEGELAYEFVEPSPGLARRQARETGLKVHEGLAQAGPITGVLFANEVLDALPFHRLVGRPDGEVQELYVRLKGDDLVQQAGPLSTPSLDEILADSGVTLAPGQVAEVSLVPAALMRAVAGSLRSGYALFIDYGDEADTLYQPRERGTLRTYSKHVVGDDPFEAPGEQDLTADVDFTQARREAQAAGLQEIGYVSQGRFLLELGIAEDYAQAAQADPLGALKTKTLFMPGGMGERFKVLGLAKDAPLVPALPGFSGGGFLI